MSCQVVFALERKKKVKGERERVNDRKKYIERERERTKERKAHIDK